MTGAAGAVAGAATDDAVQHFADAIGQATGSVVQALMTWWVRSPSLVGVDAGGPVRHMQGLLLPVTVSVATAALIWQGILLVVRRKPDPLFDVGRGLLALAFYSGAGVTATALALRLADVLAGQLVDASTGGELAQRLGTVVTMTGVDPGLVIVLGILIMVVTLVQWVVLFFRQASIVVLAGFMPLAAAGSMTSGTRPWLRRLLSWMLSLILYKPMVAACYAVGFLLIGDSTDLSGVIVGFVVLILAVVALPALLRFFSWAVDAGAPHLGSGFGAATGAAAGAASVVTGFPAGGGTAAMHAAWLARQLGSPGGGNGGGTGGSGPTGPTGASGPSGPAGIPPQPAGSAAGGGAAGSGAAGSGAAGSGAAAGGVGGAGGLAASGAGAAALPAAAVSAAALAAAGAVRAAGGAAGAAMTGPGPTGAGPGDRAGDQGSNRGGQSR